MDALLAEHAKLTSKANLGPTISNVQHTIDLLSAARNAVASKPDTAALTLAKLNQPIKKSFENINDSMKHVYKVQTAYGKALERKFKNVTLPTGGSDVLASQEAGRLVERAIGMHLLREGQFGVASTFVREVNEKEAARVASNDMDGAPDVLHDQNWTASFTDNTAMDTDSLHEDAADLQSQFAEMYTILSALRHNHELAPAIDWSRSHSAALEARGSNLEFELSRLKFIELYTSSDDPTAIDPISGPLHALQYARTTFPTFSARYTRETATLLGSLAYSPALHCSPYEHFFAHPRDSAYDSVSASFTREFCGLLGLAEKSPLYTAVTAGGIALPVLEKYERVMKEARSQWTSINELPVETPLPPEFLFHSIFVCPVSKEQATDANPPMMLPCGHVIARESLEMHSKGKPRMKCPYCPGESNPRDAKRVYI